MLSNDGRMADALEVCELVDAVRGLKAAAATFILGECSGEGDAGREEPARPVAFAADRPDGTDEKGDPGVVVFVEADVAVAVVPLLLLPKGLNEYEREEEGVGGPVSMENQGLPDEFELESSEEPPAAGESFHGRGDARGDPDPMTPTE